MRSEEFPGFNYLPDSGIPAPFVMNCWKHHLGYILKSIEGLSKSTLSGKEILRKQLALIGSSQTDLYTGPLCPTQIATMLREYLEKSGFFGITDFSEWVATPPKGYKNIMSGDGCSWTVLFSGHNDYYIHLHPARYSENSIRIKAGTLKTLIALKWVIVTENQPLSLALINLARKDLFDGSPVKSLNSFRGIRKYSGFFGI